MNNIKIYQIFYDEISKAKLQTGFIALDNTENLRPDWFEFWVILNYLRTTELSDNIWYGFLSPKFYEKTGVDSNTVVNCIENLPAHFDVANFSGAWDQACYFKNPWEQGEFWHPGITRISQDIFTKIGLEFDIANTIVSAKKMIFSNYVIAKKKYWEQWRNLAEIFFDFVENSNQGPELLRSNTSYGSIEHRYPMKTFIQERFPSLLLSTGAFEIYFHDRSSTAPLFERLFDDSPQTRILLQACDLLKNKYDQTSNQELISSYAEIRSTIALKLPPFNHVPKYAMSPEVASASS